MAHTVRAADAAVQVLREFGVRFAFTVPGESFLGILDALVDEPQIQLVAARHEGGAAFMAEAVGKLTGVPALCMGTRAVGTANLAIGIHTAFQDSTPLLAIVGHVKTSSRHREAFQEIELASFLGEITKWAVEVPTSERLPDLVYQALRASVSGRPGPTALAVRADILEGEAPADIPVMSVVPRAAPFTDDLIAALDLLRAAERPLIIAGGGVLRSGATGELIAFAEQTQTPVMCAFRRHDAFPNDHRLFLGALSPGYPPSVIDRVRNADVVLAIGTRLGETTTLGFSIPADGTQLIHVDVSPEVVGRSFPARVGIAADARETLRALLALAADYDWPDRCERNTTDRERFEREIRPEPAANVGSLVDPTLVLAELRRQLPANAVVTSDAGNFSSWLARYLPFFEPGTFLGPISGAMGYAVPAAVAASLVHGSRVPAVAVAGDGGFMMTASELAVAAQYGLDVTCIVFNNSLYGTIRMHQERAYPGRISGTELWSPDFVRYAEAFGGVGVRIDRNADIADGLRTVLAHRGISILEVAVDPETIYVGQTLTRTSA